MRKVTETEEVKTDYYLCDKCERRSRHKDEIEECERVHECKHDKFEYRLDVNWDTEYENGTAYISKCCNDCSTVFYKQLDRGELKQSELERIFFIASKEFKCNKKLRY